VTDQEKKRKQENKNKKRKVAHLKAVLLEESIPRQEKEEAIQLNKNTVTKETELNQRGSERRKRNLL